MQLSRTPSPNYLYTL